MSHRRPFMLFVVLALGGLAAHWAVAAASRKGPKKERSKIIYPSQALPIHFSHVLHVGKLDTDCDFCHENAEDSQSSLDNLLPREESCRNCHAIDRSNPTKPVQPGQAPARCDACHQGYQPGAAVARLSIPVPNLKFSHQAHTRQGIGCERCHGDLVAEGVTLATREQLPTMSLCLSCHENKPSALSRCTTCHLAEAGERMKTAYPQGSLAPSGTLRGAAHDLTFRTDHKFVAQNDSAFCESCHTKSFCNDCHNGVSKPMDFHMGDYIALHGIDARRDDKQCTSCHRLQTFCTGCHARSGVAADGRIGEFVGPQGGPGGNRYHPAGWASFDGRSASHHAFEAQRNIRSCASCHREEFCLDCHSQQSGSFGINPHPRGWARSWRCRSLKKRAGRMCLRCHLDPSELTCDAFGAR